MEIAPSSPNRGTTLRRVPLAFGLAIALAACGSRDDASPASQVAARVGDSEISVHQINQVLGRTPLNGASKEAVQAASQQVLERLIDQQLAVDEATQKKLHRSPEVVAQLEAARRDVLARAYLQQVASSVAKPSDEEVRKYYRDNPALFAERRIYNLQELRVPNGAQVLPDLRRLAEQGRPIEEFVALLRSKNLPFSGSSAARAAEQIPLELLPRLHALRDGQGLVVVTGDAATLLRVASSQAAPVSEAEAAAGIVQFLTNRRATEAVVNEIKRLRESTTIAYVGDFQRAAARTSSGGDASPAADPASAATPALAASSPVGAKPSVALDPTLIERGLQGLK